MSRVNPAPAKSLRARASKHFGDVLYASLRPGAGGQNVGSTNVRAPCCGSCVESAWGDSPVYTKVHEAFARFESPLSESRSEKSYATRTRKAVISYLAAKVWLRSSESGGTAEASAGYKLRKAPSRFRRSRRER